MNFRFPKDDRYFRWTSHSKSKMMQYRLSEQRIRLVISRPQRVETGIAPKTSAAMKRNDTPSRKEEIWVMYQDNGSATRLAPAKKTIISAWRYPGVSSARGIPVRAEVAEALAAYAAEENK